MAKKNILQKLRLTPGTGLGAKIYDKAAPEGSWQRRYISGQNEQFRQIPNVTPEQAALIQQNALQGAQNTDFNAIENLAQKRFNEQGIQSIMSRFLSHGQNQNSSAMQAALSGARADLDAQLAAQRAQYGLQQSKIGLQPQFDTYHQPESYGFLGQLAPMVAKAGLAYATGGLSEGGNFLGSASRSPLDRLFGINEQQPRTTVPNSGIGQDFTQWQALEQLKEQGNPENSRYKDFFDQNSQNQKPWNPGIAQIQRPGAFGANPVLNQLLSRLGNPGVGNYIPAGNWQQPQDEDPSLYNAIGRGLSPIGRAIGRIPSAVKRFGQMLPDETMSY